MIDNVTLNVVNYDGLPTNHLVLDDVGASWPGSDMVMLGMPFFLGRTVYVGVAGQHASIGTGPFFAYTPLD